MTKAVFQLFYHGSLGSVPKIEDFWPREMMIQEKNLKDVYVFEIRMEIQKFRYETSLSFQSVQEVLA